MRTVIQPDPRSPKLVMEETPVPTPNGPDEYLVRVKAACMALNEINWEVEYPSLFTSPRERVPGTECSGIVVSSPPEGCSGPFRPGDEVYFRLDAWEMGTFRDYTIARAGQMALKPKSMGWVEAGATPLSSMTAYQGLFRHGLLDVKALHGNEKAFERNARLSVLVTAAAGSVGSWVVQLAAAAGAGRIIAVCGPSKAAEIRKAGATDIIDYTTQSIAEWVGQEGAEASGVCDMALDCIGGASLTGCWSAVKEDGVLLSLVEDPNSRKPESVNKTLAKSTWFLVETCGADLAEIATFIDVGQIKPLIDSVFEFEQFQEASRRVESGKTRGKVVVKVDC